MDFLIFLLLSLTFLVTGLPINKNEQHELQEAFLEFALDKVNDLVSRSSDQLPDTVLISLISGPCKMSKSNEEIPRSALETILVEKACGSEKVQKWCAARPGRSAVLTRDSYITLRSTMVKFQCELEDDVSDHEEERNYLIDVLVLSTIFGMIAVLMFKCRKVRKESENERLRRALKAIMDNSMDTITLDSTRKEKNLKELARTDDTTDLSIGTLFTL